MKNFLQIPNTKISVHYKLQTSWCLIKMKFILIGLITDERVLAVKKYIEYIFQNHAKILLKSCKILQELAKILPRSCDRDRNVPSFLPVYGDTDRFFYLSPPLFKLYNLNFS